MLIVFRQSATRDEFRPLHHHLEGEPTISPAVPGVEKLVENVLPHVNPLNLRTAAEQPKPSGSRGGSSSTIDSDPLKVSGPNNPSRLEKLKRANPCRREKKVHRREEARMISSADEGSDWQKKTRPRTIRESGGKDPRMATLPSEPS